MTGSFVVHPSAIVHPSAHLSPGCYVGPYSIIGPHVFLHNNVRLESHVVIEKCTTIGEYSAIGSFSVLGSDPQHLNYSGQETHLIVGKNAKIREHVTIHRGTQEAGGQTTIGDRVFLMVGVHIAHDCSLGNDVVMANQVTLAGHVQVGDHAVLGGLCAVHQFTRIGEGSMVAGLSGVKSDVMPYGMVLGYPAKLMGINRVKLKRLKASHEEIRAVHKVFQWIFCSKEGSFFERVHSVPLEWLAFSRVKSIHDFLKQDVKRSLCVVGDMEFFAKLESLSESLSDLNGFPLDIENSHRDKG